MGFSKYSTLTGTTVQLLIGMVAKAHEPLRTTTSSLKARQCLRAAFNNPDRARCLFRVRESRLWNTIL